MCVLGDFGMHRGIEPAQCHTTGHRRRRRRRRHPHRRTIGEQKQHRARPRSCASAAMRTVTAGWRAGGLAGWHSNFILWLLMIVACYMVTNRYSGDEK